MRLYTWDEVGEALEAVQERAAWEVELHDEMDRLGFPDAATCEAEALGLHDDEE